MDEYRHHTRMASVLAWISLALAATVVVTLWAAARFENNVDELKQEIEDRVREADSSEDAGALRPSVAQINSDLLVVQLVNDARVLPPALGLVVAVWGMVHTEKAARLKAALAADIEATIAEVAPLRDVIKTIDTQLLSGQARLAKLESEIAHAQALAAMTDDQAQATRIELERIQRTRFAYVVLVVEVLSVVVFVVGIVLALLH